MTIARNHNRQCQRRTAGVAAMGAALALILLVAVSPLKAQSRMNGARSCFDNLQFGRNPQIVCRLPIRPEGKDLSDLIAGTRGYIREVDCVVDISVARSAIAAAISAQDHIFEVAPQPVTCDVTANLSGSTLSTHRVTATFAPRITFKSGMAVDATPGLVVTSDVSRAVTWPVETYVNRGGTVRAGMLTVTNAWVQHLRTTTAGLR